MTYQLSSLGISVLALLRAGPMHGYEMFQTLVDRHADRIVKVRPGSLYHVVDRLTGEKVIRRAGTARDGKRPERAVCEITDAGITPAGYLVAFDYLLATTRAELSWLEAFAGAMRSGRRGRQQTDGVKI
jgi:DNA-binding PadR family transcriptional regulator